MGKKEGGAWTHNVARLPGRRLLAVNAHKVCQGGAAREQRGHVAPEEGPQDLLKQQRDRNAFDTAERGVRKLQEEEV